MRLRSSAGFALNRGLSVFANTCRSVVNAWHDFWFKPLDPLMIGLIRLLTGWMLLYNLLVWGLDLEAFFSDNGLQPLSSIRSLHEGDPVFSFWLWTGDQWLWPMHYACVAIAALFFLGVASRLTSVLCFLITISYSQRVPIANFGFDQILGFLCLYLSLAPSGASFSIDAIVRRWWRRRRGIPVDVEPSSSARMVSRLIQLHLCAIYLWAGFAKLKGPSWWTGEAMWRVMANQEYQTMDLTWMAQVPWLPYLIAHVTIAWEVFFIVLVWRPRLRPLVLFVGILMHLGIGAFLGMWTFGLIMAFAYLAFSDPDVWRSRLNRLFRRDRVQSSLVAGDSVTPTQSLTAEVAASDDTIEPGETGSLAHGEDADGEAFIERDEEELPYRNEFLDLNFDATVAESGASAANTSEEAAAQGVDPIRATTKSVCVIASDTTERAAIRRHLRGHSFSCVALPGIDDALTAISRKRFDAVVVHSSGILLQEVVSFCEDVSDLAGRPVIVLLRGTQLSVIDHLSQIQGISWMVLPVSLKDIRQRIESVVPVSCSSKTESVKEQKSC